MVTETSATITCDNSVFQDTRSFVRTALDQLSCSDADDLVVLMVDELVANAVDAGSESVDICLTCVAADRVRIQVRDSADGLPALVRPAVDEPRGRGLQLVDTIADGWGVDPLVPGKTLWFEYTRPDATECGDDHGPVAKPAIHGRPVPQ